MEEAAVGRVSWRGCGGRRGCVGVRAVDSGWRRAVVELLARHLLHLLELLYELRGKKLGVSLHL